MDAADLKKTDGGWAEDLLLANRVEITFAAWQGVVVVTPTDPVARKKLSPAQRAAASGVISTA